MTWDGRTVETCPHRSVDATDPESACCGLLGQISGIGNPALLRVGRDACTACCQSFPPTAVDPNPVIASLVFQVAQRLVNERDGNNSNSGDPSDKRMIAQAIRLRDWAIRFLPLTEADEPDTTAFPEPNQANLTAPLPAVEQTVPRPRHRTEKRIENWAVGVTTAPRRLPTLHFTLESLAHCGWREPHLFIDDAVEVPPEFDHLERTVHRSAVGAFPNYHLSLLELYHRDPNADAYMMVQDDVVLYDHPDLRRYLESALWPTERPCVVSPFCSQVYAQDSAGWHLFEGQWLWGAQLFIFSPRALRMLLSSPHLIDHRTESDNGLALIDHCIGKWAVRNSIPLYYPTPSLAQHIGHVSTLWRTSRIVGGRRAAPFAGDQC